MKKKSRTSLSKKLQKALDLFPEIVKKNKIDAKKRRQFVEKTFGKLARKVHREVHGKKSDRIKKA